MDRLDEVIEEIGINEAVGQVEGYFSYRESQYKKQKLQEYQDILEKQKELRYRWRGDKNV